MRRLAKVKLRLVFRDYSRCPITMRVPSKRARIWHSNTPSIRAFTRAGWQRVATVAEVQPAGMRRNLRFTFKR